MTNDSLRQTGRTTKQIERAPQGAVFIWCNAHLNYPVRLAKRLGREDLKIITLQQFQQGYYVSWLNELNGIVVDHYAEPDLTERDKKIIKLYSLRAN